MNYKATFLIKQGVLVGLEQEPEWNEIFPELQQDNTFAYVYFSDGIDIEAVESKAKELFTACNSWIHSEPDLTLPPQRVKISW